MFPDKESGLIYCSGRGFFIVDTDSGKMLKTFKTIPYANQLIWDEEKKYSTVKSTVGEFAVYRYGDFTEPIWRFKLKKVQNTDDDFFAANSKIYGRAHAYDARQEKYLNKYVIIDIEKQAITQCSESEIPSEMLVKIQKNANKKQAKWLAGKASSATNLSGDDIPEKYETIPYVSCYLETEKYEYVGSWECLRIIPKNQYF